jgi:hypothetical protein
MQDKELEIDIPKQTKALLLFKIQFLLCLVNSLKVFWNTLKKRKLVTLNRNSIIKTWKKVNQEELVEDLEADQSLLKKEKVFLRIKLSLLILDNKFMKPNLKNILQIKSEKYSKKKRQHQSKLRKSLIDLLKFRDLPLRELNLETKIRANTQENLINQICFLKTMKKD